MSQQWELRPKGPLAMLPVSPTLKDSLDKFIKPSPLCKVVQVGDKVQWFNTDFASNCISP